MTNLKIMSSIKDNLRFTTPLILSNLLNMVGGFFTMYFIAQLGRTELSAGALIYSIYGIYMTLALSFFIPISIMIGRSLGAGELTKVGPITQSGLIIATLIGIPCILIMSNLYPILVLFHQPNSIAKIVSNYFHSLSYSVLPFLYLLVFTQFLIGISKPKVSMAIVTVGLPMGLVLTYGMLFGKFGMPAYGIVGAAYANIATGTLSLIGTAIYLYFNFHYRQYNLFSLSGYKTSVFNYLFQLLQLGWPIAIQRGAEMLAFCVLTFMMGLLGGTALGAQQIVLQFTMLAMLVAFSFSQTGGVLVGQAYGKQDINLAYSEGYTSILLGSFITLIVSAVFYLSPLSLISMYVDVSDPHFSDVTNLAITLFKIGAFILFFDSIRNIVIGVLRGFYDMRYPMTVGVLACWLIGIPCAYLFGFVLNLGAPGLTFGFMLGIAVSGLLLIRRFHQKRSLSNSPSLLLEA